MIGIVSDIHGNYTALKEVLSVFDKYKVETIFCLGDIVGYYTQVNECCYVMRQRKAICLMGNHDWYMITGMNCPRSRSVNHCLNYQKSIITKDNLEWLSSLPLYYKDDTFSMLHGGWQNPIDEYLSASEEYFNSLSGKLFFSGHTHVQQQYQYAGKKYVNPGSVGQPRDGDNRASYALFNKGEVELRRVSYDYQKTISLMEQAGFDAHYYNCLKTGANHLGE